MMKPIFLLMVLAVPPLVFQTAHAGENSAGTGATFKGYGDLIDKVQIATGFSPDKHAVTVLFRNLQTSTDSTQTSFVRTRTITVSMPMDTKEKEIHVTQDVRGYVSTQGKARAVLLMQAAGKTNLIDLKKPATKLPVSDGSAKLARESAVEKFKGLPATKKGNLDHDFMQRVNATIHSPGTYQVTFVLLVERETADASASVTVDSLDVEIRTSAGKK